MKSAIIGYPYIGEEEEWIHLKELFRSNKISSKDFKLQQIEGMMCGLRKQKAMGLDVLTIGDSAILDRMLDTAFMFNLIPSRFRMKHKKRTLDLYFDMAYGDSSEKCSLNNWFETSYCYVEPEYENQEICFKDIYFEAIIEKCKTQLQCIPRVTLIGPMTLLMLAKGVHSKNKKDFRDQILKGFLQLFEFLKKLEVEWVQLEEPAIAYNLNSSDLAIVRFFYQQLAELSELKIMLTIPYELPSHAQALADLPVSGIGFDVSKKEFPDLIVRENMVIALGIVDALNVWAMNESQTLSFIKKIEKCYSKHEIWLQSSASLMHVPVTKKREWLLVRNIYKKLAFADEKIEELVKLVKSIDISLLNSNINSSHKHSNECNVLQLSMKKVTRTNIGRRWRLQQAFLQLPNIVLTTNDFQIEDNSALNEAFVSTFSSSVVDLPAYVPCKKSELIHLVADNLLGMINTEKGNILISFNESFKPPIQYENIQWHRPIFLPYVQELKKNYMSDFKMVMPGPITMIKSSFLHQDYAYETLLQQITHACLLELQSLQQHNIQMFQFEETWLYRKLHPKSRAQQRQLKLEIEALHNCISYVREMVVVQVHTKVWKQNFKELLRSNIIDVVSLDFENEHCILQLHEMFKGVKVAVSMNLSWFIADDILDWKELNKIKAIFNNHMLWFNIDLPTEEINKCRQMLKEIKVEKIDIPLRYV